MRQHEAKLQKACVRWFRLQHPNLLLFHVPNGGRRDAREGAKFKAMGVLAGIPDLFLDYPCGMYHGLRIELKAGKGKTTESQQAMLDTYEQNGYKTAIVRSFEEFKETVTNYLKGKA